jgi:uncharacterized protein YbaA (DUF1428 family)
MAYIDGLVIPVPKKKIQEYRRIAQKAGRVWKEHGALEYRESVGDDLNVKGAKHRDRVNAKVMKDPRLAKYMEPDAMPFDGKRMVYGGFKTIVDL